MNAGSGTRVLTLWFWSLIWLFLVDKAWRLLLLLADATEPPQSGIVSHHCWSPSCFCWHGSNCVVPWKRNGICLVRPGIKRPVQKPWILVFCGVANRSIKGFPRMWNILSHVPWARDHSLGSEGSLDYSSALYSVSLFWLPSGGAATSFAVCTAEPHQPGWTSVPGTLTNSQLKTPVIPVAGLILHIQELDPLCHDGVWLRLVDNPPNFVLLTSFLAVTSNSPTTNQSLRQTKVSRPLSEKRDYCSCHSREHSGR